MRNVLIVTFFVVGSTFAVLPQQDPGSQNKDSLEKLLSIAKDTQRVNLLNLIAFNH